MCDKDSENMKKTIMEKLREGILTSFNDFRLELENFEKAFSLGKPQHQIVELTKTNFKVKLTLEAVDYIERQQNTETTKELTLLK